ncbi:choline dehydrogenase [Pseudomonas sp. BGr12]|uniref:choline dehydrogenase n=1 Tax=Pseudomonas sp. BGr12 TaxID=2936269 RepID=UPI002559A921|nr:choline dehydrogenase [Pseudomonas sp. BJa5]MDL2428418.1 choline dehydrogenase [Pseudomonas sp. BJa5]
MKKAYDYIIVGAGSAGCVLANRLSECGKHTICLLEAGGSDRSLFIQMPSAVAVPMSTPKYTWQYESEPEPRLNNRKIYNPRGKVLGGCSSINGMVYQRGHPHDFDEWESAGATNWGYAHVLPYFRRSEARADGGDTWRGSNGPLKTRYGTLSNPLYRAFIEAGKQAGYPESHDLNGYQQEGFGRFDMTVHEGRRWSSSNAYLRPALSRSNLTVLTHASAQKINVVNNVARSLEVFINGSTFTLYANREIILSGGAINSPQLLMLSGIGDPKHLQEHGIPVVKELQGVGKNLQDHLSLYLQVRCKKPVSLNGLSILRKLALGSRWLFRRDGLGATNHFECGAFIRSKAGIKRPDIEIHFLPIAVREKGSPDEHDHGFQVDIGPTKSLSAGEVTLRSIDPAVAPRLNFNYMSRTEDWEEMRKCVRLAREILHQPALSEFYDYETVPGPAVQTDEEIDEFIAGNVQSGFHPSGTCKMGSAELPDTVVDPELKVIGVENLRVVDSSIIPCITNANLNAPTIMIAEKAADIILGKTPLKPIHADYYIAPNWAYSQR